MKTNLNNLLFDSTIDNNQRQIMDDTNTNINKDNTLMKYFFEEKNNKSEILEEQINLEKIEFFYKRPIKLRNTLEKCYWDRQIMVLLLISSIAQFQ